MRTYFNVMKAIGSLIGGGGSEAPTYFQAPILDNSRQREADASEQAKRTSAAQAQNRVGAASSLLTAPDTGTDFAKVGGKKTLLGGA